MSCAASTRVLFVCATVCFWVVVFVLITSVRVFVCVCFVRPLLSHNALARRSGFRRVLVCKFPLYVVSCAASARRVCCLVCAMVCIWVVVFGLFTSVRVCCLRVLCGPY